MTAADQATVIAILLAADVSREVLHREHLLKLARTAARTAPTPELRTVARLQIMRLSRLGGV